MGKLLNIERRLQRKIDPLDRLFSIYIRMRDGWTCQKCGQISMEVEAAHFHGQGKKSVRYEDDNACALCQVCHDFLDENPIIKRGFFTIRLGNKKIEALDEKANNPCKVDRSEIAKHLREEIKKMEAIWETTEPLR